MVVDNVAVVVVEEVVGEVIGYLLHVMLMQMLMLSDNAVMLAVNDAV